jgi:hypothetical protein
LIICRALGGSRLISRAAEGDKPKSHTGSQEASKQLKKQGRGHCELIASPILASLMKKREAASWTCPGLSPAQRRSCGRWSGKPVFHPKA